MRFLLFSVLFLAFGSAVLSKQFSRKDPGRLRPFERKHTKIPVTNVGDDAGVPLYLTPFINNNLIDQAREYAEVDSTLLGVDVTSYSGFFTVDETVGSNMFFWYFPSESDPDNDPVVLWLQGGPGASSLFGLFVENGPFYVDESSNLVLRNYSWSQTFNLVYIDNPVGTGYSYTNKQSGYASDESDVAVNLYSAVTQFFQVFTELQDNDFYVTGESYGGKYVPALAYYISQQTDNIFNLKGIAVGDGFTDPVSMVGYGDYLYNVGVIDQEERLWMNEQTNLIRNYVLEENWSEAWITWDSMLGYYSTWSGLRNDYNYYYSTDPTDTESNLYEAYIQSSDVRKAIHVGSLLYDDQSGTVYDHLIRDMFQSVKPWLESLLASSNYKILYYSGQLDVIVGHTQTQNLIRNLIWDDAREYATAEKTIWRVDNDIAGYVKNAGQFTYVIVRNAGHMVPYDQPQWGWSLINNFINDLSFSDDSSTSSK